MNAQSFLSSLSNLAPTHWIQLAVVVAIIIAMAAGYVLKARRAKRRALIEKLSGRLGPDSSYTMSRITLAGVFAEDFFSAPQRQMMDDIDQSRLERDRGFDQGRFETYRED